MILTANQQNGYNQQMVILMTKCITKGIENIQRKTCDAATKQLDKLHKQICFTPVNVNDLTTTSECVSHK